MYSNYSTQKDKEFTKWSLKARIPTLLVISNGIWDFIIAGCKKVIGNSLFIVGEIGGNDYGYPLSQTTAFGDLVPYIPQVVSVITSVIRVRIWFNCLVAIPISFRFVTNESIVYGLLIHAGVDWFRGCNIYGSWNVTTWMQFCIFNNICNHRWRGVWSSWVSEVVKHVLWIPQWAAPGWTKSASRAISSYQYYLCRLFQRCIAALQFSRTIWYISILIALSCQHLWLASKL